MIRFFIKGSLFLCINLVLILGVLIFLSHRTASQDFTNSTTRSNLFFIKENDQYDWLILGTSHAEVFSREGQHDLLENQLKRQIINLSEGGGGGGLLNQLIYTRYFFEKENKADTIIYFIDPFVFYNTKLDENPYIYEHEPLDWVFFKINIEEKIQRSCLINYLTSKAKPFWWHLKPIPERLSTKSLSSIDTLALKKRLEILYPNGIDINTYKKKKTIFLKWIDLALEKTQSIVFIIPPTLYAQNLPKHETLLNLLEELKREKGIAYYDFSDAVMNPRYYHDHDHLNPEGMNFFIKNYWENSLISPQIRE